METKRKCNSCHEVKSIGDFYLSKGFHERICKKCKIRKKKNKKKPKQIKPIELYKPAFYY